VIQCGLQAVMVSVAMISLVSVAVSSLLDAGPAVYGWNEDQRWTLARVAQLIRALCRISYTPAGYLVSAAPAGLEPAGAGASRRRARQRGNHHVDEGDLAAGGTTRRDRLRCSAGCRASAVGRANCVGMGQLDRSPRRGDAETDHCPELADGLPVPDLHTGAQPGGSIDQLTVLVKTRLKKMQHRPGLIDSFIAETGLTLATDPP
jgi:hypothetical protein